MNDECNTKLNALHRIVGGERDGLFKAVDACYRPAASGQQTPLSQLIGNLTHKALAGALVSQMMSEHDTTGRRFYYGHGSTYKGRTDRDEPLPGLFEAWDKFKGPLWDKEFLYLLSEVKGNFNADTFRHDFAEALVNALYARNRITPKRDGLEDIVDELLADPPTATKAARNGTAQKANNAPHRAVRVNTLK